MSYTDFATPEGSAAVEGAGIGASAAGGSGGQIASSGIGGMGASVLGAAVSAYSNIYSGKANRNQANYLAAVNQARAQAEKVMSAQSRMGGEVKAQQYGLMGAAERSRFEASTGARNVALTGAAATGVSRSITAVTQENERIARYDAARLAYGEDWKGAAATADANIQKITAQTAMTTAYLGAITSITGGAVSVADKWTDIQKYGGIG